MSFPSSTSVVVRGALQNVSILYRNQSYIGDSIFPLISGLNYQTKIVKYGKQPWFTLAVDGYRAENATAKRVDFKIATSNMDPSEIAFAGVVSDELLFASQQPGNLPIQPISDTVLLISDYIDRFREKLVADTIFGTSDKYAGITWADGAVGGTIPSGGAGAWASDSTTNSIIADVENAKSSILSKTGVLPNTLEMDYATFQALKVHATATGGIFERIKYTQSAAPAQLTESLLAGMLGLDSVIVGKAIYTTDKETKLGTMTTSKFIWDPTAKGNAFLYYKPAAAGLKQVAAGYQYRLSVDGASPRKMISYREEAPHHTVYEVAELVDIVPMCTDVGYLFKQTYSA